MAMAEKINARKYISHLKTHKDQKLVNFKTEGNVEKKYYVLKVKNSK